MIEHNLKNEPVIIEQQNKEKDNEIRFDISKLKNSKFKNILIYLDSISLSPVEYLLTGILSSLSGAIGKKVYFNLSRTTKIYLNVWAVIIGRSTIMRKTTAINLCVADMQDIELKNYKNFQKDLNDYKRQLEIKKNKKTDENISKPNRNYLLFPQDSTIESLSDILANSERGLLTHSEFGSFLSQLNRGYSADAKQFLTNIFDVPATYEVSRVTKDNLMLIRPYLSILGASTIDWIQEHSTDSDLRSGFFARFIYSIRNVPDKRYIALLKLRELTKKSDSYTYSKDIYQYLSTLDNEIEIDITPAAAKLHIEYDCESYLELLNSDNDNELSFKARLLVYCLKFAGLIALCEKRFKVTENDMKDAIEITNYYKRNVEKLLNNELNQNDFTRKEQKIIDIVKKKGGKILRSDLMNFTKLKASELDELIINLSQKELIETSTKKHPYNKKEILEYHIVVK